jgi:Tat protein secretion system quality control protein TatD with DNase activity
MSGRAEPWMVKEVVKTIAKIKGMDDEIGEEKVRQAMLNNAKQFFRILL